MTKAASVRAHCPECDGERTCDVHGMATTSWKWESPDKQDWVDGGADHSLLQCRGCETVFYLQSSWNSEEIDQWYEPDGSVGGEYSRSSTTYPKPTSKTKPAWFPAIKETDRDLSGILDETYLAYDSGSLFLATVGIRTAIDRATELLGIDAAKTFEEKLAELHNEGWIGETERLVLEVVINAGSAAAHRGWRPDTEQAQQLLTVMEVFLQKAFIVEKKALSLEASIPPRPKRIKPKVVPAAVPAPVAPPAKK